MSDDRLKKDSHLVRRLFHYLRQHKGLFILALLLYPVSALAIVLPPYLVQQILDVVINFFFWEGNGSSDIRCGFRFITKRGKDLFCKIFFK